MDLPLDLDRLLRPVAVDRHRGASQLLETALTLLLETLDALPDTSDLGRKVAHALRQARPDMTPFFVLALALEEARGREEVRAALARFQVRWQEARERLRRQAALALPPGARILSLSQSGTVLAALEEAWRRGRLEGVLWLESRPQLEGRAAASRLAAAGIPVVLAPDAAAAVLVEEADGVWLGVDALLEEGVWTRTGSVPLAAVARRAGVPVWVLAEFTKIHPPGAPPPREPPRDPREVWEAPPSGVTIWNRYFELLPWDLVDGVITEEGVESGEKFLKRASLR